MQKIIFTITVTFFCFVCFSQEKWDKSPVIKTNIFNLLVWGPSIGLDIPVSKKISITPSVSYGKYSIFGRLRTYKSYEAEVRSHRGNVYYGGYLKHTVKTFNSKEKTFIFIPLSDHRDFKGNGLAIGASTGAEAAIGKRLTLDLNLQLGYGRFYTRTDKFSYNLPSPNFIDYRIAFWIGFRL